MYADIVTDSMRRAIDETNRRREKQQNFNQLNGISPESVRKEVKDLIDGVHRFGTGRKRSGRRQRDSGQSQVEFAEINVQDATQVSREIDKLEQQMHKFASDLEFENAAEVRDRINALKNVAFLESA